MDVVVLIICIGLIVCLIAFGFICFSLIRDVAELKDRLEYYKSVCSQIVEMSADIETKLDKHLKKCGEKNDTVVSRFFYL